MAHILTDVRIAVRSWKKSLGLTIVAIASIALGIGANSAIFTLVDQVLLRTLPVQNPQELVQVTSPGFEHKYGNNWGDGSELSFPMYQDIRDNNQVFAGVFGRFGYAMHISYGERTERVLGELVTGTYFPVLGVRAALGRTLTAEDDQLPGGHPVAVLSHAFWTSRFASNPAVLGQTMILNSHPFTIVGVAQAGFEGIEVGRVTQVFVPMMMKAQMTPAWNGLDDRRYAWVRVFARLAPSVTREQALASLEPFYRSRLEMEVQEPAFANASELTRQRFVNGPLELEPSAQGRSGFRRRLTTPLWVLMGIASGVLLIACANVANLLLARGAARQREMAIRLALGAGRRRLVQQLLVESVMLALVGGVAGVVLAAVGAPIVLSFFVNPETPAPVSTLPDLRIRAFTFGVSALTGILFGLAPAWQSTRPNVAPTLKDQAGNVLGGQGRLRKALVASQVTVSLLLLIGAGLFLRTLNNLLAVDTGLAVNQLIAFNLDPSLNGYSPERSKEFAKSLLERLESIPGVQGAGLAIQRLLEGNQWSSSIKIEGYEPKPDERMVQHCNSISPGYFKAIGVRLVAGRDFDHRDERSVAPDAPGSAGGFRVAIANERFVKQYFGDTNPIGRRIGFGGDPTSPTPIEIIGVVTDSKYTDVRTEAQKQLFFPYLEQERASGFAVYVRASRDANTLFQLVRQTVQQLDPNLPVSGMMTLEDQVDRALSNERLVATMSATFGVLATLLAVVGLYGVMAYSVARRTREIGIRMALGARGLDIGGMVIREVVVITAIGVTVALPAAWFLGRYVSSQLYGVEPMDVLTVAAAIFLLGIVAVCAGLVPSRRAASIEPTTALRYE